MVLPFAMLATAGGMAQAQSAVTVYGLIDLGIVHESGGPAGSATKMESGITAGSRIGFKGTEDLGSGLSAHFQIESGFGADTGVLNQGGLMFGRQAFVGVTGGFGTVNLGRQYNPLTNVLATIDPFGQGYEGTTTNIVVYPTRMDNTIYYTTPSMRGLVGEVAYGAGEVAGQSQANRQIGLALSYTQGPVYAALVHHRIGDATGANENRITLVGGSYAFGPATVALSYNVNKDDVAIDSDDTLVGLTLPFGASKVMLSWIRHNDKTVRQQDSRQLAIGYAYTLSKRTMLHASYGRIDNRNGAPFTVGNSIEVGTGDRGLAAGIVHAF